MVDVAQTAVIPSETNLQAAQSFDGLLESTLQLASVQNLVVEAGTAAVQTSNAPLEGNGNHVAQTAVASVEARFGVHGLGNVRLELVGRLPFTAQVRIEALRRTKLAPTLAFEGGIAAVQTAQLAVERQLRATRAAVARLEAAGTQAVARTADIESRGFIFSAVGVYVESKLKLAITRLVSLERQLRANRSQPVAVESGRSAAPVNVTQTVRINLENRKFKGWHIESAIYVRQTATFRIEAYGFIDTATGVVNFENGDNLGRFGVIHRLSNKSTLIIVQRPTEGG